jgi:hypothetical protein
MNQDELMLRLLFFNRARLHCSIRARIGIFVDNDDVETCPSIAVSLLLQPLHEGNQVEGGKPR